MPSSDAPGPMAAGGQYDGELASSILLDDGDGASADAPSSASFKQPTSGCDGSTQQHHTRHSARHLAPHQRAVDSEAPNRTPTRTPSPVYQYNHPKDRFHVPENLADSWTGPDSQQVGTVEGNEAEVWSSCLRAAPPGKSSSSTSSTGGDPQAQANQLYPQVPPLFYPYWSATFNPQAQAYYGMIPQMDPFQMVAGEAAQAAAAAAVSGTQESFQMFMAMQAAAATQGSPALAACAAAQPSRASARSASPPSAVGSSALVEADELQASQSRKPRDAGASCGSTALAQRDGAAGGAARQLETEGKRMKSRNKDKEALSSRPAPEAAAVAVAPGPRERGLGSKGDRRRRGGEGNGEERPGGGGKSRSSDLRPQSNNPMIEQLKARDRNVELSDLAAHISEIAQDQYGSRLIQQKLEMANDEEKQLAFKSVLQKMPQLTTDVFGNYVIQKFFEFGNAEQRRILAEQLVGQVLKLSLQMYGCRVVQKALDSVPIEQQVLLIGELKGNVLKCIEDQHGNHVIQKCIERLPTDRIGFIVESFVGQTNRMAKHCYGCRVIQRLIEYCASCQISPLLEEVLRSSTELATDQYGNYVVQHVMEHSSRPGDRQAIMQMVRKQILMLSCHKYASNVIEKALACGTLDERALLIYAIVGEQGDPHPPLLTMMRDRFGNYIVQRVITMAQGSQRDALLYKLHEHMPALKKSNSYGKHIISALERAQQGVRD
mmetsp:Transcript_26290/g.61319  ORF Transcript_26290/g.61319 Transcript_26290/m.61319 type:complete len:718 (+) Transcript_26290:11-2164(+)